MTGRAASITLAALLACGLAGCAVGPDYKRPTPPADSTGPLPAVDPRVATRAAVPDDWWRLYRDPALDALLTEAFARNETLAEAEANVKAARAVLEAARVAQYPSTELEASGVYGRDPTTSEIVELDGRKPSSDWVFAALLDSSYELDLFGRVRRSIEARNADAEAVAAARDAVKVAVAAGTARAYAEICAVGEEIDVARRSLALVSHQAEITRARFDAGAGSQLDTSRADTLVAQTAATIPPLQGRRRVAWFQLAALLGRAPQDAPPAVLGCIVPPRLDAPLPVGDGAALLRRRPDVREAERELAADTARIGVAIADLYPRISLTGFYGGVSDKIDLLDTENALAWGVGPSISWTFPNIAGPLARIHQTKAGAQAALAHFDATILDALKETAQALSVYTADLDRHADLVRFQTDAQRTYDLTRAQFVSGSVSHFDLLATEQTLLTAQAQLAASDEALVQDQIAVFKALGGGWQQPTR